MSKHSRWIKKAERWTWKAAKWTVKEATKPKNVVAALQITTTIASEAIPAATAIKTLAKVVKP